MSIVCSFCPCDSRSESNGINAVICRSALVRGDQRRPACDFRVSRMGIRPERARLNNSFSIAENIRKN